MTARPMTLALLLMLLPAAALATNYKLGTLTISQPWARATAPTAPAGAGFLKVTNTGTTADRLTAAKCPVANMVQIHEMKMDGNVMRMRELEHGLDIPPGATVSLDPGGFHLMLMQLKSPLKQGTTTPCVLTFEKAGSLNIELQVEGLGATKPGGTQ